ncbi:MAG: GDSL-type esterase/lipase family protein [Tractidigestivibacter sp.]|jgi:lysophospholipase L1-like esterase|uniref:GDSL-type esterase/lipase family protein n=1 Tax=Tractidigestivibacter sp. TaxID=2847320 RepID=UPI003D918BEC
MGDPRKIGKNDKARVLCFGDSLTWGYVPAGMGRRWPWGVRWTSLVSEAVGCQVIEEGLPGRTTCVRDPLMPFGAAIDYVDACVLSQLPLDLIITMLGSNDLKDSYHRSAEDIAASVMEVVAHERRLAPDAKMLVVSPPALGDFDTVDDPAFVSALSDASVRESKRIAGCLQPLCEASGCAFFDAATVAHGAQPDAMHLDQEGNRRLADALVPIVRALLR